MSAIEVFPFLLLLAVSPLCIRALILRDRLFRGLYENHRDLWRQLGCPSGWMWRAPEGALLPEMKISFGMLLGRVPDWLATVPDLHATYFACRRMLRLWNYVVVPLFMAAMFVLLFLIS